MRVESWVGVVLVVASAAVAAAAPDGAPPSASELRAELAAKLREQPSFQTTLSYRCAELEVEGTIRLAYDAEGRRLFLERREVKPEESTSYVLFERGRAAYWSGEEGFRGSYDPQALSEAIYAAARVTAEVTGEKAPAREAFLASLRPELAIDVTSHAGGTRPSMDIGFGLSTINPGSWLRAFDAPDARTKVQEGQEGQQGQVLLTRPGGLHLVVDRRTGFFLLQRLSLPSGTFELSAEPLAPLESFPTQRPPETIRDDAFPLELLQGVLIGVCQERWHAMGATPADELEAFGRLHTHLARAAVHAWRQHLRLTLARRYLRQLIHQGVATPAELERDLQAVLERFEPMTKRELELAKPRELGFLSELLAAALRGEVEDSPRAKAIRAALAPERVLSERGPEEGKEPSWEEVLRQALAAERE